MEGIVLVGAIALIGGFFFCRIAYESSTQLPWFKRAIYVALFALVVIAFATAAYFHSGRLAIEYFVVGFVLMLAIGPVSIFFKVDIR